MIDLGANEAEQFSALAALTHDLVAVLLTSDAMRASDAAAIAHQALDLSQRRNPPPQQPACRKGCGHCCRVYVSATVPEILLLARAIRALPPGRRSVIVARVCAADAATGGRDWSHEPFFTYPCPLLEDEACSLHPERPDACRGVSSFSADACKASIAALASRLDLAIPRVEEHGFLRGLHGHALWAALRSAGLSDVQYSLNQALRRALDTPDAEARWLAGEDVFTGVPIDTSVAADRRIMVDATLEALVATVADEVAAAPQAFPPRARSRLPELMAALVVRPEREDDRDFRLRLFCDARPEMALLPLDPAGRDRLVRMQVEAQDAACREQFPQAQTSIVELDSRPIGRLAVDRAGGTLHLVDIALVVAARGAGIGTRLLRSLMEEAAGSDRTMRLSVAAGNIGALRLYRRLGFIPIGREPMLIRMEWQSPVLPTGSDSEARRDATIDDR